MSDVIISTLPSSLNMKTVMSDNQIKKILMEKTAIPKQLFLDNDPEAVFLFAYCSNPSAMKEKFSKFELDLNNNDDVKAISELHKQKVDVDKLGVNFLELIQDIKIDPTKVSECMAFCD